VFTRLHLRNFRGFTELELAGLGRVNLIVGRNNSGKTSLLEAIWILCQPGRFDDLPGLLRPVSPTGHGGYFPWLVRDGAEPKCQLLGECERGPERTVEVFVHGRSPVPAPPHLPYHSHNLSAGWSGSSDGDRVRCQSVSPLMRGEADLVRSFDEAMSKKGGEEAIEGLLRQVDPRVRRIRLRASPNVRPYIEVDLGLSERIPLTQVGHGLSRLVEIFSELLAKGPQVYLVDEIENGIHFSLLPRIWAGLGAAARQLGTQVFVATHSHECILAAHAAFAPESRDELRLIQLFRSGERSSEGVQGRVLDRELIEAAVRGDVDLR
jgi:predicted ATPase